MKSGTKKPGRPRTAHLTEFERRVRDEMLKGATELESEAKRLRNAAKALTTTNGNGMSK